MSPPCGSLFSGFRALREGLQRVAHSAANVSLCETEMDGWSWPNALLPKKRLSESKRD